MDKSDLETRKKFGFEGGDVPFCQLRFLGIMLQVYEAWTMVSYNGFMPWLKRQWPIDQQWEQLEPRLEWLAILCPLTCEVVVITRAPEAESKYHAWKQKWEWSYSLDMESQQFREEMGHRWANVTWRVTVPHSWNLWKPIIEYWFQEKSELCKDHSDIGDNWHEVNRPRMRSFRNDHPRLPDRLPTPVEDGDGCTYVGPI